MGSSPSHPVTSQCLAASLSLVKPSVRLLHGRMRGLLRVICDEGGGRKQKSHCLPLLPPFSHRHTYLHGAYSPSVLYNYIGHI